MVKLPAMSRVALILMSTCICPNLAHADCNPRDFMVQDITSLQQSGDTELAFVLTSTQSEYDNAKKGFGGSGAYGLFSSSLSWGDAKERARQISQATSSSGSGLRPSEP